MKKIITLFILTISIYQSNSFAAWYKIQNNNAIENINTNVLEQRLWKYLGIIANQTLLNQREYNYQLKTITKEIIIYINAFCDSLNKDNIQDELIEVYDGGNCYFQIKYNTDTKTFFELQINGES